MSSIRDVRQTSGVYHIFGGGNDYNQNNDL